MNSWKIFQGNHEKRSKDEITWPKIPPWRSFATDQSEERGKQLIVNVDILAAVKRTAIPHHATFLGWSLNGVDASPKNA